jgi:hypothetical protein
VSPGLLLERSASSVEIGQRAQGKEQVVILAWSETGGGQHDTYEKCSVPCYFTHNRSRIEEADALSWYLPSLDEADLPDKRPGQSWILVNDESPCGSASLSRKKTLMDRFDVSVGKTDDSSVQICPDQTSFPSKYQMNRMPLPTHLKNAFRANGTGLVLYIQDNCDSHREDLVKRLEAAGVPVDAYGKCRHNKYDDVLGISDPLVYSCGRTFLGLRIKVHFAIGLEDCRCTDYVSEKLFRRLREGVVPIYEARETTWTPSNSVLDPMKFESVEEMAHELLRLDKDDNAYDQLLAWKTNRKSSFFHKMDFCETSFSRSQKCRVCDLVHQRSQSTSFVSTPPKPSSCLDPR